jgi:hypothetical protein
MKARIIGTQEVGQASTFNVHALSEVFVYFKDECVDEFCKNVEVFVESINNWLPLLAALEEHLVITDNYDTSFFEPKNKEDKERGFTLY